MKPMRERGAGTALAALLDAVCHAPSARGWLGALVSYETLLLREMGYGGGTSDLGAPHFDKFENAFAAFDRLFSPLEKHLLADRYGDVMSARNLLRARLAKIAGAV